VKRIGPELKMPKLKGSDLKVPAFFSDLYYDLRDRRLLPLIGLILVAIVAAPFLLKDDPADPAPAPAPVTGGTGIEQASEKTLTVVKAAPGLRNYKKRLSRREPTDPFKQRFTAPVLAGSELGEETTTTIEGGSGGGESGEGGSAGSETSPSTPSVPPAGGVPGGGDSDGDEVPDGVSLFTYTLDLQVTRIQTKPDGTREKVGPKLHKDVKAPTPLPGGKTPVVTYLGLGAKEPRLPMFLVSSEVTAIYGEAKCIAGTSSCQLIALERGFPVTFVYGENDTRYKINLLDITPVPVKAPQQ
jgi:hypothetical protein